VSSSQTSRLQTLRFETSDGRCQKVAPNDVYSHRAVALLHGHAGAHLLGYALVEHSLGHSEQARHALDQLLAHPQAVGPYGIAEVYAWRGDTDEAFDWLQRAYSQPDSGLQYITFDPLVKQLRGDRRYKVILRQLGIAQ
jgi:hypothetical protein